MTGARRRIVFAGTPDFAVPSLDAIRASGHEVVAVLTQPDRPAGRGRALQSGPVKRRALEYGLPVLQPVSLKQSADRAPLRELEPDLVVVVAYGLLLPRAILDWPRLGCVNVHASLLPRWRGAAPVQAALLAGDEQTGVCLMQLDEGLDTGPVLACEAVPIGPRENASELHDRLARLGAGLLAARLDDILSGNCVASAQPAQGITYAGRINKADARLDWRSTAVQLDRQVRAYHGWPVAFTLLDGRHLRIWRAEPAGPGRHGAIPGEILADEAGGCAVQTGDGALRLLEVQMAGRGRVSAQDFLRGNPAIGKCLGR